MTIGRERVALDQDGDDDAEAWGDDAEAWGGETQEWGGEPQAWGGRQPHGGGQHTQRRRILKRKRTRGGKGPLPPLAPDTIVVIGRGGWPSSEPRTPHTPAGVVVLCQDHGAMHASTTASGTWYCPATLADGSPCTARYQGRAS